MGCNTDCMVLTFFSASGELIGFVENNCFYSSGRQRRNTIYLIYMYSDVNVTSGTALDSRRVIVTSRLALGLTLAWHQAHQQ